MATEKTEMSIKVFQLFAEDCEKQVPERKIRKVILERVSDDPLVIYGYTE